MTTQMKDFSASDQEGLLCGVRHISERYLGLRIQSPEMEYGIQCHEIARAVNEPRMDGREVTREDVIALVKQSPIPAVLKSVAGGAEEAMLWWHESTMGTRPLDVEKIRRVQIGSYMWQIKADCVRTTEDGVLLVDDFKKEYVPPEEEARRNARFMTYAVASRKIYGYERVESRLWNLGNKYVTRVEWLPEELDRMERYIDADAVKITAIHQQMTAVPESEWPALVERMEPQVNEWCKSCPVGLLGKCKKFNALLRVGVPWMGVVRMTDEDVKAARAAIEEVVGPRQGKYETYEAIRASARVLGKIENEISGLLKSEAVALGAPTVNTKKDGTPYVEHVLQDGDREAVVKTTRFKIGEFTEKHELLKDVFAKGEREEVVKRGKTFAVRSLDLGDGLTVSHQCNVDKEPKAAENAKEGQRISLSVRRAL